VVRAVLDTQIVVRGLLGIRRSACAHVFEALAEGAFTALASPHILTELRMVLTLPRLRARYGLTDDQVSELIDAYSRQAEMVAGSLLLPQSFRSSEGSPPPAVPVEDIPIVAAALEGGAEHLVTDDSGLLDVKTLLVAGYQPVKVTAPGPFVDQVLGRPRGARG
jgi:putative PIN family toxin of toxin-antitoxin system